jgi:hypothetical protein
LSWASNAVTYRTVPLCASKRNVARYGVGALTLACGAGVQKVFNSGADTPQVLSIDVDGTSYARQGRAELYCINSTIDVGKKRKQNKTKRRENKSVSSFYFE